MYNVSAVGGCPGAECYLLCLEQGTALIDSGFGFCAEQTAANLEAALRGRPLDYILLTHSHYDHVLGSPAIKALHPEARIVASAYARDVMAKESARAVMRGLNTHAAQNSGWPVDNSTIDKLHVDLVVDGGDTLQLGSETIEVIATPGHTNCCVSYFLRGERLLVAAETIGVVLRYPDIVPGLLVSYRNTMESIDRVEALRPGHLLSPHTGMIPDSEIGDFFVRSRAAVEAEAAFILGCYQRGRAVEQICAEFKDRFYGEIQARFQPAEAFEMNTAAMVPRLLRELAGESGGKTA